MQKWLIFHVSGCLFDMPITNEDKILIKILFVLKGYNAKQLVKEFPSKGWNVGSVYKLLQKLLITGLVDHRPVAADDTAQHSW